MSRCSLSLRLSFFSTLIVILATSVLSAVVFFQFRIEIKQQISNNLSAIADYKANELNTILEVEKINLLAWRSSSVMVDVVVDDLDKRIHHELHNLKKNYHLPGDLYVFNQSGILIASSQTGALGRQLPAQWIANTNYRFIFKHRVPFIQGDILAHIAPLNPPFLPQKGFMVLTHPWSDIEELFKPGDTNFALQQYSSDLIEVFTESGLELRSTDLDITHTQQIVLNDQVYLASISIPKIIGDLQYKVIVFTPKAKANAPFITLINNLLIAALVVLTIMLLAVPLLSHQFVKPIKKLTSTIKAIEQSNDLSSKVQTPGCGEIADLANAFNSMSGKLINAVKEAEKANTSKSEFLSNMSHELRTPLHGILSFARLGLKNHQNCSPEKLHKYFNLINVSGERLLVLLNDLLDLSKLEAKRMDLNLKSHCLFQLAENCVSEQSALLTEKKLTILWDNQCSDTNVECDSIRISQVIANLLSNAIKFSPTDKTITLSFADTELSGAPAIKLSVSDQGLGIPETELESVFDKFIQSSKTNVGAGGTGLGLAICKEIIHLHHGTIWAESELSRQTTLSFIIPISNTINLEQ